MGGKGKADTAWLDAGYPAYSSHASPGAVQDLLGHTNPRMTVRYAHVVDMAKKPGAVHSRQGGVRT